MPLVAYLISFLILDVLFLIRAELKDIRRQIYVFKPIATLTVITIASLSLLSPGVSPVYSGIILAGLCLSLAGDLALMFPKNIKAFRVGLACFLMAHLVYSVAFLQIGHVNVNDILPIIILLSASIAFFMLIRSGLDSMKVPVIAYVVIISVMVASAIIVFGSDGVSFRTGSMVLLGALLFYISDLILAANRFWKPWKFNRISLAFYYSGQVLIALSATLVAIS